MANKPDKGLKNGSCNHTCCQEPPADYYNHSTRKWYCRPCAMVLNKVNHECLQIYGYELCTHETSQHTINALNLEVSNG